MLGFQFGEDAGSLPILSFTLLRFNSCHLPSTRRQYPESDQARSQGAAFVTRSGLERNVVVIVACGLFLLGAGEQLWNSFLPKYLEVLGASAAV